MSTSSAKMTTEEMVRFIRYRQHELAVLKEKDRCVRLAAEIRQQWRGVPPAEQRSRIQDLERHFPLGITEGPALSRATGVRPALLADASADNLLAELHARLDHGTEEERRRIRDQVVVSLEIRSDVQALGEDELARALADKLGRRNEGYRQEVLSQLAKGLGVRVPSSVGGVAAGELILGALHAVEAVMLAEPDPVFNENLEPFSEADIRKPRQFALKLKSRDASADSVSQFLWGALSTESRQRCDEVRAGLETSQPDLARADWEERLCKSLARDLNRIVGAESLYDAARFSRVRLSRATEKLIQQQPQGTDRVRIRLNQALLEEAYPEEIRCCTVERELLDGIIHQVQRLEKRALSAEQLAELALVLLVELGGLERLAKHALQQLEGQVFDEVNGKFRQMPRDGIAAPLSEFLAQGDLQDLTTHVRGVAGLIKSLLCWFKYATKQGAIAVGIGLREFDPKNIEREFPIRKDIIFGKADYKPAWDEYCRRYKRLAADSAMEGSWVQEVLNFDEDDAIRRHKELPRQAKDAEEKFLADVVSRGSAFVAEKYSKMWELK